MSHNTLLHLCGVLLDVEGKKSMGFSKNDALHGQRTTLQRLLCFVHIMWLLDMLRHCMEALISLKKCCQDVFDLGSESLLWWVCLVADNKYLLGIGKLSWRSSCNVMKHVARNFRQLLRFILRTQYDCLRKCSFDCLAVRLISRRFKQPNVQPLVYGTESFPLVIHRLVSQGYRPPTSKGSA